MGLTTVEIMLDVQEKYGVPLSDEKMRSVKSINDFIGVVASEHGNRRDYALYCDEIIEIIEDRHGEKVSINDSFWQMDR